MKLFIETYKNYDIYLETNEETTGNSPYYEIVDRHSGIRYLIYEDLESIKRMIDEMTEEYIQE